jgi:arylsulfatase A
MFLSIRRRDFLKLTGAGVTGAVVGSYWKEAFAFGGEKPNIVFIMADDVSPEVLGCYGGTTYKTPNIDKLAETGTRFTHCYSSPVCAPTRVKLLTGRYGFRNYKEWGHIPDNEITFGHILKDAGYATALAGKWQMVLQKNDPDHITKMGFEQNSVFGWHEGPRYNGPFIYENGKSRIEPDDKYGPDIFCKFLIDFIKANKNKPFLAYHSQCCAHAISNDLPEPPPVGAKGKYQTYKELVEHMDKLVGRIVDTLDELGIRDNTLILFTTDNGTPGQFITRAEKTSNDKYRYIEEPIVSQANGKLFFGGKGKLTDAGTLVPLIANWPGTTPADRVCNDLIDFSDFMPTFAKLAGAKLPTDRVIDGMSFVQQIKGQKGTPRKWAYCQWKGEAWVRNQRWKLYRDGRLYDIKNDPLEKSPIRSDSDTPEMSRIRSELSPVFNKLIN